MEIDSGRGEEKGCCAAIKRQIARMHGLLLGIWYWTTLVWWWDSTMWMQFDVYILNAGGGEIMIVAAVLIIFLIPLILALPVGALGKAHHVLRNNAPAVAMSFIFVASVSAFISTRLQNVALSFAIMFWRLDDFSALATPENQDPWFEGRMGGLVALNLLWFLGGGTNPLLLSPFGAAATSALTVAVVIAVRLISGTADGNATRKATEFLKDESKCCGGCCNAAGWVSSIGPALAHFLFASLLVGSCTAPRYSGTDPAVTGLITPVVIAITAAVVGGVPPRFHVKGIPDYAFVGVGTGLLGAIIVNAAGPGPGRFFGVLLLAVSLVLAVALLRAPMTGLKPAAVASAVAAQGLLSIIIFVLSIDTQQGGNGVALASLLGQLSALQAAFVVVLWILIFVWQLGGKLCASKVASESQSVDGAKHLGKRGFLTPVALFAALVFVIVVYVALPGGDARSKDDPLVVASWNVQMGHSSKTDSSLDGKKLDSKLGGINNFNAVANFLKTNKIDVVGLQEAGPGGWPHFGNRDPLQYLAAYAGYTHGNYGAPTPVGTEGCAVATRLDVADSGWEKLPVLPSDEYCKDPSKFHQVSGVNNSKGSNPGCPISNRILAWTKVKFGGTTVTLYSTHLDWKPAVLAEAQVRYVIDKVAAATEPAIVVGDFNVVPESPAIAYASSKLKSAHTFEMPTEDADGLHIDYIYYNKYLTLVSSSVNNGTSLGISDHYPLLASFRVENSTAV